MSNYMKEVAQVLGVELGEEFRIQGIRPSVLFKISERGLVSHRLGSDDWATDSIMLVRLLTGDFAEIIKLPWKPKKNEEYFIPDITMMCNYSIRVWNDEVNDEHLYQKGIVFKTAEEAIEISKKMLQEVKANG